MRVSTETEHMHRLNRRIFGATATTAIATVLVKVVSMIKEFVVAANFGRSDGLDAFLLAALFPGLLVNLVSESMNQALIPTLIRKRESESKESAQRLLSNCLVASCVLLIGVAILVALMARPLFPLIGSRFAGPKALLVPRLLYGLLPVIILAGLASTFSAVLNTVGEFAIPAIAPIITPLVLILAMSLCANRWGSWVLVYGTLFGAIVHAGWTATMLRARGYYLRLRWYKMDEATREVAGQFGPLVLSGMVASGGLLVDQGMAAMLPSGNLSALVYAGRFVSAPMALLGGAISAALTPAFSETIARHDWDECGRLMSTWAWASLGMASAIAAGLIAASRVLVRMTLQHGAFGTADTSAVSAVLTMYAMQIPFFVSSRVFYRFLIAARRTDLVFYCGLLNLVLDVVLNVVLMRWMGVAGIALATSLWTVSTFIFLWYWSGRVLARASVVFAIARAAD